MEFFTLQNFEYFLLILVRISAFILVAPFFSMSNTPIRLRTGFSIFLAFLLYQVVDLKTISYQTEIEYGILVLKEFLVGLLLGYFANICTAILNFAGQVIDMEIGLSMVNLFDPVSKSQTSITGNFYMYLVMLMLIITNMHHYILIAFVDTYTIIPVGEGIFRPDMYLIMIQFMVDYFIIGFRIVLPIFASSLLINIILGIMAKIAPQMNMFVIGMQLKIFAGLVVLFLMIGLLPNVSDFVFNEMDKMMKLIIRSMSP
ncbi:flagellar biosynthetic protein FliR [Mobilisporobacter senegalensis]|uniref:Flagellar biosynthetic protein FliR n=1 Tax=Mobilisporobacter senegalensis TaxID=1329262 RepID=A0A3N1XX49_9FIRM|nr:flagellar biosynthetic protein FliR [Mobilisporobacter senegalensis]ROR30781.1 flagellar biosynthetic protein FliR [Mobilisporobacter senegalensis]